MTGTEDDAAPSGRALPRFQIVALAAPAAAILVTAFFWGASVREGFGVLYSYLPLTLPVLSVIMAVALNPRELAKFEGWVRLTNPVALGLVAFAIWYFVASQGADPYVRVGDTRVLKGSHSLLLVIFSFVWAGYCSVVAVVTDMSAGRSSAAFNRVRVLNFWLSVAFLFAPVAFFQTKDQAEKDLGVPLDLKTYAVSIPFRDPALNLFLGRSTAPLTQATVYLDVKATTPTIAVDSALSRFRSSPAYLQFQPASSRARADTSHRAVEIQVAGIVAQERR